MPFVVTLQNGRYDRAATRLVAPLLLATRARVTEHYLAPRFILDGVILVLDVFNLATIPVVRLGAPVASLADEASSARIVRALDELLSRA